MNLAKLKQFSKVIGAVGVLSLALVATIFGGSKVAQQFAKASSCQASKVTAVQVTTNSAVVNWETTDVSQGRVEYGTSAMNLSFTAPESTSGKTHNVPLTLLTPNTVYYYLISIGDVRCDSSGQACTSNCVPWSFTTTSITSAPQPTATLLSPTAALPTAGPTKSVTIIPTQTLSSPSATVAVSTSSATPTSGLSLLCQQVKANLGKNSQDSSSDWNTLKKLDIDGNGTINGLDVIKCQQSGK